MLIVLLAAFISTQNPPVEVNRSDYGHGWTPTSEEVAAIDAKLKPSPSIGGPRENFDRFYTGVFRDGHRVVAVRLWGVRHGEGVVHIIRPEEMLGVIGGGCQLISFSFDTATDEASLLECNPTEFWAPPPPPPQPGKPQ